MGAEEQERIGAAALPPAKCDDDDGYSTDEGDLYHKMLWETTVAGTAALRIEAPPVMWHNACDVNDFLARSVAARAAAAGAAAAADVTAAQPAHL